jgi:hypothetical protein
MELMADYQQSHAVKGGTFHGVNGGPVNSPVELVTNNLVMELTVDYQQFYGVDGRLSTVPCS